MKRTITIDTDLHKVVPIETTPELRRTLSYCGCGELMSSKDWIYVLSEIPADLPGVIEHNAHEVAALRERLKKLEKEVGDVYGELEAASDSYAKDIEDAIFKCGRLEAQLTAQPTPEAIIDAALEAAADCADEWATEDTTSAFPSKDILALDKAAILQAAKEAAS